MQMARRTRMQWLQDRNLLMGEGKSVSCKADRAATPSNLVSAARTSLACMLIDQAQ